MKFKNKMVKVNFDYSDYGLKPFTLKFQTRTLVALTVVVGLLSLYFSFRGWYYGR